MITEEQKRNDERFGNRRKMAFYSLYVVIFVTLALTYKILVAPATDVLIYSTILSWGISILGSIILAFIGAASFEQTKNPLGMTGISGDINGGRKFDEKVASQEKKLAESKPERFQGN